MEPQEVREAPSSKDVVLGFLTLATAGDSSAFDLVAADFVQHAAGPQGRDGLRQTAAVLEHDLGPGHLDVHHAVAEDGMVAVHLTFARPPPRVHDAAARAGPRDGREVSWTFLHLFRVADGLIAEHWACRDDLGLLGQLRPA